MNIKINSMDYWNERFQTNWESFSGREQTSFFLQMLLDNLPDWLLSEIEDGKYFICDAGCAEGDGTKVLFDRFPKSDIVGIDFSIEAVNKAKDYYPEVEFAQGDIMNLTQSFDVIFCSNVLEHFSKPFDIIPLLMNQTKKHLIIMIPFLEYERIKEHMYTFEYSSFPLEINDYNLTYFKEVDGKLIEGTHWYGKQAIIVYSNKEVLANKSLNLSAFNHKMEFYENGYFDQLEQINILEEQVEKIELDKQLFQKRTEEKDAIILNLTKSLNDKETIIKQYVSEQEENEVKISQFEDQIAYNNQVLYHANHQLISMQKTKGWRFLNQYYNFMHSIRNLKNHTRKFVYIAKTKGFREAINRSFVYLGSQKSYPYENRNNPTKLIELYNKILSRYKDGTVKGIAIIPSAFEFEEIYNQRTINLAKHLVNEGYAVIYVAWQWNKSEELNNSYKCFLDRIYQVPLFDFLETQIELINEIKDKKFFITFPTEEFYRLIVPFRENAFHIVYDIMDEWEEFYNTGEAPWYKKDIEEAIVLNSDLVVGVSEPLKEKFSFLRNDILVIGNGYDENTSIMKNISLKKKANDNKIHIGYFGHLTSSWFDWSLVFELADSKDFFIHLIGYGADDKNLNRLKEYKNIKYYGKVHPGDLHSHVKNWHVGLIPFKQSKLSVAVDPIKIYEYLFFGLPTISTGIPHIGNYPMVTHCEGIKDVLEAINNNYKMLLAEEFESIEIKQFLKDTTWENRFNHLLNNVHGNPLYQKLYIEA